MQETKRFLSITYNAIHIDDDGKTSMRPNVIKFPAGEFSCVPVNGQRWEVRAKGHGTIVVIHDDDFHNYMFIDMPVEEQYNVSTDDGEVKEDVE